MRIVRLMTSVASVTLVSCLAVPVSAQVAAPATPTPSAGEQPLPSEPMQAPTSTSAPPSRPLSENGLDTQEIVVTAQKTSSVASRTPVALSVFSGQALQDQGVTNVQNLGALAPGLVVGNAAQGVNISIRGVQSTDYSSKGEQSNAFNIDGIPIGRPQIAGLAFFDLERVEVLRGPQGTLYGKSSTGGAINVITAKPKNELSGAASVELGNFSTRRGDAFVNVPLTPTLAVRAAVDVNKRDGYVYPTLGNAQTVRSQDKLNDEDNYTARLSALWHYLDNGSVTLTGTFGHIGGTGNVNDGILYSQLKDGNGKSQRRVFYNPQAGRLNDHFYVINGEVNQDLGPVHVSYDGAYVSFDAKDNKFYSTGDPNAAPGFPKSYTWSDYRAHITENSNEIRFSNAEPGRLTWVVGGNIFNEKIPEQDHNWQTLIVSPADALANNLPVCAPPTLSAACNNPNPNINGTTKHKSEGVFGQASFAVTDRLKLTGGVRYSRDHATRDATIFAGPGPFLGADGTKCGPLNTCVTGGLTNVGEFKGHKITWRAGVEFQMTPSQLLYATISTGYKPGSFNDVDPTKPGTGSQPYGYESLTSYEVGYKGKILPNLQVAASGYYYDYSKFQLTGATFLTPNFTGGPPLVLIYTTIVPVKMYGAELEATWRPSSHDTIGVNLTSAAGHYSGLAPLGFIFSHQIDFKGKRLDLLAHFTSRVNWEHRFDLSGGGFISARVATNFNSGYYNTDPGGDGNPFSGMYSLLPQQYKQGSFTRTDLNLGYTNANGKLSVDAFVRNVENDLQQLGPPQHINGNGTGGAVIDNRATIRVSDPRFYGVRLTVRY